LNLPDPETEVRPRQVKGLAVGSIAVLGGLLAVAPVRHALGQGLFLLATGKLGQFQQFLLSLGAWAPLVSAALMVAEAVAVPVPVTIIMVANGLVFGVWPGMLVSLAGGLTGGLIAYTLARLYGRTFAERLLPATALSHAERLMSRYGRGAVVLARWIPGVPGDPIAYAAGVTRLPAHEFLAFTLAGLVPANLATAYLGSQVPGDVPTRYWIGGVTAAAGLWIIWRLTRRAS
jgi:uncharacterized membrane protein YdjX (TVP38/TMEM64 family)